VPIYEQGYRRYEARGPLRTLRFWPITREALRLLLARKLFLVMMIGLWVPFIVFVFYVFLVTQVQGQMPQVQRLAPLGGRMFQVFLAIHSFLALFPALFGGAGLIASDLKSGAILVYLSRPLTRRDYVVGKLGVLLALTLSVTLVPGLALYAIAAGLAPQVLLTWEHARIAPAVALQSLVTVAVLSMLMLAISALTRSARVAGLTFFALLIALGPIVRLVRLIGGWPLVSLLSLMDDLRATGDALLGVESMRGTPPAALAAVVLAAVVIGAAFVLRTRVRAVEIVK
jgi:ABC-2 type transport system permease protein